MERNLEGTAERAPLDKVQPGSLAGSVLFSTPIGARSMRLGGRGRGAEEGTVYDAAGKEAFEAAIDVARRKTVEEVQRWGQDGAAAAGSPASRSGGASSEGVSGGGDDTTRADQPPADGMVTPPPASVERKRRERLARQGLGADGVGGATGSPRGACSTPRSFASCGSPSAAAVAGAHVEARILAKVVAVVSPAPAISTRTLARRAVASRAEGAAAAPHNAGGAGGGDHGLPFAALSGGSTGGSLDTHAPGAARRQGGAAAGGAGRAPTSSRRGGTFRA
ncbi:hypothetical protein MNEG_2426 [Monoraphidium neglectum]|uniref:Uncharacterized protein n=1 Tax=Monoraphidium neglectum TaxID=145388 RepID=A0A0D2LG57_9CHLO|nr:hypothetical protein MNEG_2426 [Monoraphidium neglectum]KIZ05539.1 hypothetical protein MNEG_2426 [Monoraphidium neglectum]|eukprot:XP_013904558.1 hypothetical protein MNEG_2426 [Monoraphidium neglectum]